MTLALKRIYEKRRVAHLLRHCDSELLTLAAPDVKQHLQSVETNILSSCSEIEVAFQEWYAQERRHYYRQTLKPKILFYGTLLFILLLALSISLHNSDASLLESIKGWMWFLTSKSV